MASGGPLKFTWPATWLEVIRWDDMTLVTHSDVLAQFSDHTGMDVTGTGVKEKYGGLHWFV